MKALITCSVLCSVILSASVSYAADEKIPVPAPTDAVAVVNGAVITVGQVQDAITHAPAGLGKVLAYRKMGLVNEMVSRELLYQDAVKKGLDKEKDIAGLPEARKRYELIEREVAKETGDALTVSDAEVKKYYDAHPDTFRLPERVRVSHIFVNKKDDADFIVFRLKQNKDQFARLAALFSASPSKRKGGDLGYVSRGKLDPALDAVVFSLKVGEISSPVKTPYGYHIAQVTDRQPAVTKRFEDVSGSIRKNLSAEKRKQAVDALVARLRKEGQVEVHQDVIEMIK